MKHRHSKPDQFVDESKRTAMRTGVDFKKRATHDSTRTRGGRETRLELTGSHRRRGSEGGLGPATGSDRRRRRLGELQKTREEEVGAGC
ncbi:hypothetical protein NL676_022597 [Syzygium grande]|nr:hypothetical protein NL676_022597 [Syzygium grande]